MAYIRWGEILPSGAKSNSYVIGDPDALVNLNTMAAVPYTDLKEWIKTKNNEELKQALGEGLDLEGEELGVVCERLYHEKDKGEWD